MEKIAEVEAEVEKYRILMTQCFDRLLGQKNV